MSKNYECKDGVCVIIDDEDNQKIESTNIFPIPNEKNDWTVYGAEWCGYCKKTKQLLEKEDVNFIYYDIDKIEGYNKKMVKEELKPLIGDYSTIPIIFKADKFIGGYNEIKKYF